VFTPELRKKKGGRGCVRWFAGAGSARGEEKKKKKGRCSPQPRRLIFGLVQKWKGKTEKRPGARDWLVGSAAGQQGCGEKKKKREKKTRPRTPTRATPTPGVPCIGKKRAQHPQVKRGGVPGEKKKKKKKPSTTTYDAFGEKKKPLDKGSSHSVLGLPAPKKKKKRKKKGRRLRSTSSTTERKKRGKKTAVYPPFHSNSGRATGRKREKEKKKRRGRGDVGSTFCYYPARRAQKKGGVGAVSRPSKRKDGADDGRKKKEGEKRALSWRTFFTRCGEKGR